MAALVAVAAAAFELGDPIPLFERTRLGNVTLEKIRLGHHISPVFGRPKTVLLRGFSGKSYDEDMRVQFEMGAGLGWRTQWLTVVSAGCASASPPAGGGAPAQRHHSPALVVEGVAPQQLEGANDCFYLHEVAFTFLYDAQGVGARVVGMRVVPSYGVSHQPTIRLHFAWHQAAERDLTHALHVVYGMALAVAVVLTLCATAARPLGSSRDLRRR